MTNGILTDIRELDSVPDSASDRFNHNDLIDLGDRQLVRELTWLRMLNYLMVSGWHQERELAIASELKRRRDMRNQRQRERRGVTQLSKGYAPVSHEELEAPISGGALQLLLRIRRDCDDRETDGHIVKRHLNALAVAHEMSADIQRAGLAELSKAKLVRKTRDGYLDVNFLEWCRPAEKREVRRKQFRAASKRYRGRTASADDSTVESTPLEAETVAEEEKETEKEANQINQEQNALRNALHSPAEVIEVTEASELVTAWCQQTGRPVSSRDIAELTSWEEEFGFRVSVDDMVSTLGEVWERAVAGGVTPEHPQYVRKAIRELYERTPHNRLTNGATTPAKPYIVRRGIGEPCEVCGKVGCRTCEATA